MNRQEYLDIVFLTMSESMAILVPVSLVHEVLPYFTLGVLTKQTSRPEVLRVTFGEDHPKFTKGKAL